MQAHELADSLHRAPCCVVTEAAYRNCFANLAVRDMCELAADGLQPQMSFRGGHDRRGSLQDSIKNVPQKSRLHGLN